MLEYHKDGQKVECRAIWDEGYTGQAVVLTHIKLMESNPLAHYPQPSVFTIMDTVSHYPEGIRYLLRDGRGKEIMVPHLTNGFLYDADEWVGWELGRQVEKIRRKNNKIRLLEAHLDLLKNILISQGFRVISAEQAAKLGIE